MGLFECWKINSKEMYLYTGDKKIVEYLKRDFPQCAEYYNKGYKIGWQFLLPARLQKILHNKFGEHASSEKKILEFRVVENKGLTEFGIDKFRISSTEQSPLDKSYGEKRVAACK